MLKSPNFSLLQLLCEFFGGAWFTLKVLPHSLQLHAPRAGWLFIEAFNGGF
jgi:hypothetical protein